MTQAQDIITKLIYVGDPMCSWCYGIAPNLEKLIDKYNDKIEAEIVMGGLRPYNTETMADLKAFLSHHWEDVHKASGQEFNYGILDNSKITYDTEPPCRATVIARDMAPDKVFSFFIAAQEAFYSSNSNMHLVESYYPILKKLKMDKEQFTQLYNSAEMKEKVKLDFKRSEELSVTGYPTLLLRHKDQYHFIARGFATVDQMTDRIEKVLEK